MCRNGWCAYVYELYFEKTRRQTAPTPSGTATTGSPTWCSRSRARRGTHRNHKRVTGRLTRSFPGPTF
uniref:hypothetical protein n=1 Tax=Streptomyces canus TaxID=58343 RepID=UPI0027D77078|nr:hypothetical protein [Streptomyces canus]